MDATPSFFPLASLEAAGGVRAYFTGRSGGLSPQWNGGLNWSISIGDDPSNVRKNRERSLERIGLTLERTVIAGLVHGDRVVAVTGEEPLTPDGIRLIADCDAIISDQPGLALVVTAADCVPVLLYDPVRRAVGAVHAGWRGTVLGIAGKAVQAMVQTYGCNPADILAEVGPSIGSCCYEVDEAVAGPVRAQFGEAAASFLRPEPPFGDKGAPSSGRHSPAGLNSHGPRRLPPSEQQSPAGLNSHGPRRLLPGKFHLDLWAANQHDLRRAGVRSAQIHGTCTSCHVDALFSHRAEKGAAGRGAAIIALI
ncbi:MAG TPA: peptidoglycan editing factor PgeF [Symbiobacteriaceae bacterium]|nr:peptidoglycan editing factor PgeF [Symbiobacteriaceae bacterium]